MEPTDNRPTIEELTERWESALIQTRSAVAVHPDDYGEMKALARDIAGKPLDIRAYLPTARRLAALLKRMDPEGRGSIFHIFCDRIDPENIWQVGLLRMECRDLLEHLKAYEKWRMAGLGLRVVSSHPRMEKQ